MAFDDGAKAARGARRKAALLLFMLGMVTVGALFYLLFLRTGDRGMLIVPGLVLVFLVVLPFLVGGSRRSGLPQSSKR